MYEAFYFKKNIFFTEGLADENLIEFLTEININDIESIRKNYFTIGGSVNRNNYC